MITERRWFGREPALVIQTVGAVLTMLVAFGLPGLNDNLAAAITAFLTAGAAAWTAWQVQPVGPALFSGVISTGAALAAGFGAHLTQQQVGAITAAAAMAVTLWARGQITPVHDPAALPVRTVSSAPTTR